MKKEKALLVGVRLHGTRASSIDASLDELARLADTAGAEVVGAVVQELKSINPATFIGSGKVEEISWNMRDDVTLVIFDEELTPAQNRNLSEAFDIKVLDRTAVILDIFAKRARTKEGKLQVELAQLAYRMPRLVGKGLAMMQQAGYIGNRGPGETKLEIDRRRIRERMTWIRSQLKDVRSHRELHRLKRENVPIPVVALIGYTNAGKSTLMNAMTDAGVFTEDKLFATLDPTVRKMRFKNGREILIADTVGFIRKLPHQLIESFKATFEEVARAQLLVHVIDASDPELIHQEETVQKVLLELGIVDKPCLVVYNKCDKNPLYVKRTISDIFISATTAEGLDLLSDRIDQILKQDFKHAHLLIPHQVGGILSEIHKLGSVRMTKHTEDGIFVEAELPSKIFGRYKKYCV